ncbi:hypothetical protein EMCG_02809 [[Emmonsia] crescens]|uniref:Uncharacterized protein n=1 Tax=[Emmonsia] crescens TaxID=73230 RepID=A0A0G2J113_9EURO|nr:hypothetical protein EMCG_02809 [Emmonsia crescens UAMH 3008]
MKDLAPAYGLDVNYGQIEGPEQGLVSVPEEEMTPTYAMDAEFRSLDIGRRIWPPCQQLTELYFENLRQKSVGNVEEAKEE